MPKWQHKLGWNYKRGKLVSYFLNNGAKTWLYGLKISYNIETEHVFQFKAFFHITSNLDTSCFSAFKEDMTYIFCKLLSIKELQTTLPNKETTVQSKNVE